MRALSQITFLSICLIAPLGCKGTGDSDPVEAQGMADASMENAESNANMAATEMNEYGDSAMNEMDAAEAEAVADDGFVFYKPWTWGNRMQDRQEEWRETNRDRNRSFVERNQAATESMRARSQARADAMHDHAEAMRDGQ